MWPPSSWPTGNRLRAVARRPNHAAKAIGCRTSVSLSGAVPQMIHEKNFQQQRLAQKQSLSAAEGLEVRQREADEQGRHGDDEPGDGPGDPDVEQPALVRNRLANADERAERSGQRDRNRKKIGQACIDVIMSAGDVVAELMTSENAENRRAVRPSQRAQRRARDGEHKQQRHEASRRCPEISLGGCQTAGSTYPIFCRSLPGLNRMVRPGGIRTSLPVLGLRPMPRLRGFT